jgi:hypothetical protein
MGGKTDGTSGPGVGAATMFVQEAGVGIMICGVGDRFTEGVPVVVAQAESRNERSKVKAKNFLM